MDANGIRQKFTELYGKAPALFRSPARVNLIGEHTDYNEGFVLPAAVSKEIWVAIAANGLGRSRVYACDLQEQIEFSMDSFSRSGQDWANYILGMVDQLQQQGLQPGGFDCVFGGNIPQGAGMSSSAALTCGVGFALNHIFSLSLDRTAIARLAQKAENEFVGLQCGIMDQFACLFGRRNYAIRLDCRSLDYEYIPLQTEGYTIVLFDTRVTHSLASSEYNVRRQQCEEGVALLQQQNLPVQSLRDVSLPMLTQYKSLFSDVVFKRCWYVVEENTRVEEACRFLQQGDLLSFGRKMYESHEGLSCQYEVSCPELDFLVAQTKDSEHVVGARMMGGGFAGCTINLIATPAVEGIASRLQQAYQQNFSRHMQVYVGDTVDGTEVMEA